jgi:hypothetical protein
VKRKVKVFMYERMKVKLRMDECCKKSQEGGCRFPLVEFYDVTCVVSLDLDPYRSTRSPRL